MDRKQILVALVVAAIAAIPIAFQQRKIGDLKTQLAELGDPASKDTVGDTPTPVESTMAGGEPGNTAAQGGTPPPVSALTETEGKPPAGAASDLAAMFEDPGMREMMKMQMKGQIGFTYGQFLDQLGLDKDARAALEDLLVDRQMDFAAFGIKAMNGSLSEDERAAAREAMTTAKAEWDKKLTEQLGEEQFADFQRYESSASERVELTSFKGALEKEGGELSVEAEEQLMAIMYEERTAFQFSNNFSADNTQVPEWNATPEAVDAIAADYAKLHSQVAARAGEVLDDAQMAAFIKNQESHRKMMEAGLRMSAKMLGGATEGKP